MWGTLIFPGPPRHLRNFSTRGFGSEFLSPITSRDDFSFPSYCRPLHGTHAVKNTLLYSPKRLNFFAAGLLSSEENKKMGEEFAGSEKRPKFCRVFYHANPSAEPSCRTPKTVFWGAPFSSSRKKGMFRDLGRGTGVTQCLLLCALLFWDLGIPRWATGVSRALQARLKNVSRGPQKVWESVQEQVWEKSRKFLFETFLKLFPNCFGFPPSARRPGETFFSDLF